MSGIVKNVPPALRSDRDRTCQRSGRKGNVWLIPALMHVVLAAGRLLRRLAVSQKSHHLDRLLGQRQDLAQEDSRKHFSTSKKHVVHHRRMHLGV